MLRYHIIGFDFDGTLVDSNQCIINGIQATFKEAKLGIPPESMILQLMGIPAEKSFEMFHGGALSKDETLQLVEKYRERYLEESKHSLTVYPGIRELLLELKAAGAKVGVVTSKVSTAAWENARQLGIDTFIEYIVGPREVKNPKPAPDSLRALCRHFGRYVDPTTMMVGDATFDIEMANAAGAASCAVTWGAHKEEQLLESKPTFLVRDADDLRAVLFPQ